MIVRKGSLSDLLLIALEKATEVLYALDDFSYTAQMRALKGIPKSYSRKSLTLAVRRLREKGMVQYEKNEDGKMLIRLTQKGNEYIQQTTDGVWDGKYRVVVWDIPERKRTIRNLFRRKLKSWGFVSWQKSVWVSKRNVTIPLRNFIKELELERWVSLIESEDKYLETCFVRPKII